jgi:hypothetical protein
MDSFRSSYKTLKQVQGDNNQNKSIDRSKQEKKNDKEPAYNIVYVYSHDRVL